MFGLEKIKIGGKYGVGWLLFTVAVFVAGSVWIWVYVNRSVEEQRNKEYLRVVESTQEGVMDSMAGVVERLYDLRGFVNSGEIDSVKWKNYMLSIKLTERLSEVSTFAYAPVISRTDLEKYQAEVRRTEPEDHYASYAVFPVSTKERSVPVRYLYTFDPDLETLLGYDLETSENNAKAIEKAVSEDSPTMTDLLHLGLVISGSPKKGYVVMLPVYDVVDTSGLDREEKKTHLTGLVGAWLFPGDLLSSEEKNEIWSNKAVKLMVYDGEEFLYAVGEGEKTSWGTEITREVRLLNKEFRFVFVPTKAAILSPFTESLPLLIAIGLLIANILWVITVVSVLSSRSEAVKLAEEATKDLRKFKQAVEGVSDQVVIFDGEGVIVYANKATEKDNGYRRGELNGKKTELYDLDTKKDIASRLFTKLKEEKKPFWGELINRKKNGEMYEVEANLYPITDEKDRLIYIVAIERDLSKVKAMERMKTEFIALASHQLRTPLSAVKWFSKMLMASETGKLNETQRDYVQKIHDANDREISLVNSLLNVSRIESGKIVVTPRLTNLIDLVETLLIDSKREAEKQKKTISTSLDKRVPEMMVDDDLIRHVYQNLVSNAIRYTKSGGKILVKVYLDKNRVMSEIKDNGIGIPNGEKKRIFEKFFRASNAMKKETDGNGLGLYLAKTIVESSGGKMGFRSTEGRGSTFWFFLPIPKNRS